MSEDQELRDTLMPEFISASFNLASKSIQNWGNWDKEDNFPSQGTWAEKLTYIDGILKSALEPKQHRPNARMFWRTRPDLNKYRGWLLNRILRHQLALQNGDATRFHIPEDIQSIIDSLYIFHKHNKKIGQSNGTDAGTIQFYPSLDALDEAIKPYEASYPITAYEREQAHQTYLTEHGGNGTAKHIATLNDGTEIIQVMSEDASIAYGSPRWCTAYRDRSTYFNQYKDDLLVIIDPDGERWQLHFRRNQFHDENDRTIRNFPDFINQRTGLAETLIPFFEKGIDKNDKLWKLASMIPEWKHHVLHESNALTKATENLSNSGSRDVVMNSGSLLHPISHDEDFQIVLEEFVFKTVLPAYDDYLEGTNLGGGTLYFDLWKIILHGSHWRKKAIESHYFLTGMTDLLNDKRAFLKILEICAASPDTQAHIMPLLFGKAFDAFHKDNCGAELDYKYAKFYDLIMSVPEWKKKAIEMSINEKVHTLIDNSFNALSLNSEETRDNRYIELCMFVASVPEWKKYAQDAGHFKKAVEGGHLAQQFDIHDAQAMKNRFYGYTSRNYIKDFWPMVLEIPEWKQYALDHDRLGTMLRVLFVESKNTDVNIDDGDTWAFREESNNPAKTFMFMMPLFYNRPGFRDSMTPFVSHAIKLSGDECAHFRTHRRSVHIRTEILKYAAQNGPWINSVAPEALQKIKDDKRVIADMLNIAKRKPVRHWAAMLVKSNTIPDFIEKYKDSEYYIEPIKEAIQDYEPYRNAFEQHLTP